MDHVEVMKAKRLELFVHRIMVITMRSGPDHVYLETNLPDPMGAGTLAMNFAVPRDTGEMYARANYPGVEVVLYHYAILPSSRFRFDERSAYSVAQAHEQQNPQLARAGLANAG